MTLLSAAGSPERKATCLLSNKGDMDRSSAPDLCQVHAPQPLRPQTSFPPKVYTRPSLFLVSRVSRRPQTIQQSVKFSHDVF